MREGTGNTARGSADFVVEAISRARHEGAPTEPITAMGDAGFYGGDFSSACPRAGARFFNRRPQPARSLL